MFEIKKIALSSCLVLTSFCGAISEVNITDIQETLKHGIHISDIDLVKKTLEHLELTEKDKNRFLKLACKRVDYRKIMMILARSGKSYEASGKRNKSDFIPLLGVGCFITALVYGCRKESDPIMFTGLFGALICGIILCRNGLDAVSDLYEDSVEIFDIINKA